MRALPSEKRAFAFARIDLKNDREALANVDVAPDAKQTALVALLAIPWTQDVARRLGTPLQSFGHALPQSGATPARP